jgi:glycosyltransferase involved in cell wall biosynthesis
VSPSPLSTLVLIPAFNELASLPALVEELQRLRPDLPILVVDDASTDGSGELLPRLPVQHLQLAQHLGLGGAVRAGLRYARTLGFQCVVRLDADGQHPPAQIEALLDPVLRGVAGAAVGSRFCGEVEYRATPLRRAMQVVLATLLTWVTGRRVTDPTSGFWAFGPSALGLLADHHPRGYSEPELHLFLHRNGVDVQEVSVHMRPRTQGRSSLSLPRAGLATLRAFLVLVVVPRRRRIRRGDHE